MFHIMKHKTITWYTVAHCVIAVTETENASGVHADALQEEDPMDGTIVDLYREIERRSTLVDLSPVIQPDMPQMSVHPDLSINHESRSHEMHGYYLQSLLISEHHGAHVDAPAHALSDRPEQTIENQPLDRLMGPFKKFDLGRLDPQPGQLISRSELEAEAERAGFELEPGDIALVDFGWSRYYLPDESDWSKRQWWADNNAGLAEDACAWLSSCGIRAIGSDTVACDLAIMEGEILSQYGHLTYFLPEGILIMEGLTRLDELPATGLFVALPLKIRNGSGSPLRPVAFVEG